MTSRLAALSRAERISLIVALAATVAAGVARYAGWPSGAAFALATVALASLAHIVSFGTEQVGGRFGPAVTGVLQSTLGNLPELFIVIFALRAGQTVVAQTSIIGSLFANALLVLGLVIVTGARAAPDGIMRFQRRLPNDTATLLLLATFIIVIVGLSLGSRDNASEHVKAISTVAAVALLAVYVAWVVPYVRGEQPAEAPAEEGRALLPLAAAVTLLAVAGVGSAFVSDWFIKALEPAMNGLGVSDAFAGLVVVAIAGNAVENATGLVLAHKGRSDLAVSVVKNSVAQIACFLFPALVLLSLFFSDRLTFVLNPVYIGALAVTALAVWQITGDGEAYAYEGWALVAIYVILATVTFYE
jgi:Ca2+:H+ antiporter